MTRLRVAAALAAMLTALLLQSALVAPLTMPAPASLPAVLVAAVALADGPAAGMAFGFSLGLVADLGSRHPAGVLALCWLALGLLAGAAGGRRSVRGDAAVAAVLATLAAAAAAVLLIVVHADGVTAAETARTIVPAGLVDALLALPVVALVRAALRSDALAAPHPVPELAVRGRRA
jgi:rod shape-determining protein MreD